VQRATSSAALALSSPRRVAATEFDVAADGRTITPRVIAAYPPFIFNAAATSVFRGARYQSSYRPTGGLACTAQQGSISFRLQN
jgi:hypothetical protein